MWMSFWQASDILLLAFVDINPQLRRLLEDRGIVKQCWTDEGLYW